MANPGSLRVPRHVEGPAFRPAGLPGRLRSLFSVPSWGKKPEPRVRYGEPFLPGLAVLGRQHLGEARALLERADAVRGRRFTYLGRTVGFPGRIDWSPGGLSEAWRIALNSLDDLMPIGVAAALAPTADVRRGWHELATTLVKDWVEAVPAGRHVGWEVPALSRRIPNLVYAYVFFTAEMRAEPQPRRRLLDTLYVQTQALAAALANRKPDRWTIHAGRALFMGGRFFDGMEARGWLEQGATLLWGQLREQVHEDGGHRDRTPAVHAAILADYLEVLAILQAANDDVPIWARKRVKGMADVLTRLVHPDGELALFHGAGVVGLRPVRELLATAAVVLHEPGLALPGELPGVWPLLLVGDAGRRVHAHLPRRRQAPEARALRRTGFYALPGEPGDLMLVDGGSPPADGDASALGFELSVGGMRLLVDAGIGGEEPEPWAAYFRSTRAHNAVSVANAEQIANGRSPVVSDVQWVARDGILYFGASHDGFARLSTDLRLGHRRHVFCLPGRFWIVCDQLLGTGEWEAESFLHLHPHATLAARCHGKPSFVVARSTDAALQIVPAGATEVRVQHGVEGEAPQGWYAPRPGERLPASVISLAREGRLPLVFGYALLPRTDAPATLRFEHDAFRLHVTLVADEQEYLLSVVQGDVEMRTRPVRD